MARVSRRPAVENYPEIDDYLTATMARRLNLPMPPADLGQWLSGSLSGQFELLSGGEALRTRLARQALLGDRGSSEPLDQELPSQQPLEPAAEIPPADKPPAIEAIALRVPEECFYLRSGSFENFLWLRHRMEALGGDARNLISEQAVDFGLNERLQRQLGLQETTLGDVVGPTVISDVALVGNDMFLREGAALGVLFEARNSTLLGLGLGRQRSDLLKAEKGAKEETVKLAGKSVSLISTPDNRVRSFYAVDGDYHFVSTSRALTERFLETGQKEPKRPIGTTSLGASAEFRYARTILPLERGDTAFVYLSRAFFHNLMSPHYQVEMVRRLRSATEMELALLARLLARGEGRPAETLEQMRAADVLPAGFGRRIDGSYLELTAAGPVDSLRGARGTFVPIPDMPVERITQSEARQYQDFLTAAAEWGRARSAAVGHPTVGQRAERTGTRRAGSASGAADPPALRVFEPLARAARGAAIGPGGRKPDQLRGRDARWRKGAGRRPLPVFRIARPAGRRTADRQPAGARSAARAGRSIAAAGLFGGLARAGAADAHRRKGGRAGRSGGLCPTGDRSLAANVSAVHGAVVSPRGA